MPQTDNAAPISLDSTVGVAPGASFTWINDALHRLHTSASIQLTTPQCGHLLLAIARTIQEPGFAANARTDDFSHQFLLSIIFEKRLWDKQRFWPTEYKSEITRSFNDTTHAIPCDVAKVLSAYDVKTITRFTKYIVHALL